MKKGPWLVVWLCGDCTLQLCGDFFSYEIRIPIKQAGFNGKSPAVLFFVAPFVSGIFASQPSGSEASEAKPSFSCTLIRQPNKTSGVLLFHVFFFVELGVSKNRGGPPKWMVCKGKPY